MNREELTELRWDEWHKIRKKLETLFKGKRAWKEEWEEGLSGMELPLLGEGALDTHTLKEITSRVFLLCLSHIAC